MDRNKLFRLFAAFLLFGLSLVLKDSESEKLEVNLTLPTPLPTPTVVLDSSSDLFKVIRVIDGDTIELDPSTSSGQASSTSSGQVVRYIGIDTPETVDPRKPVQCFGIEAARKNQELVEGKMVRLEKDISETDQYGRLLRYVYIDETFINLELVKQGYAVVSTYPPDVKYQQLFLFVEQEARENNRGLWAACH